MSFMKINEFDFNNKQLRGFIITKINNIKTEINDINVKFQENRAIVFNIRTQNSEIIKDIYKIKCISGKYYHYTFKATINSIIKADIHFPFYSFDIIVDLIEFSKNNHFLINSEKKFNIEIIPTKNMSEALNHIDEEKLFTINNVNFNEYNQKIRYLLELNTLIYSIPILIQKVIMQNENSHNYLFQSQILNANKLYRIDKNFQIYIRNRYIFNINNYLDSFIIFNNSKKLLNQLLKIYFITDIYIAKEEYNLNDISGYIDLFDGIFYELGGEKEEKTLKCKNIKCSNTTSFQKELSLKQKIEFIIEKLEPKLKLFEFEENKTSAQILSNFRNMVRHQKEFEQYDLEKLLEFSKGILKLYINKYILNISTSDYDIDKVLKDFDIHSLIMHKYIYNNEEIIIYDTHISRINRDFTDNTISFQIIKSNEKFKNSRPSDFIYDKTFTREIKKIHIDKQDKILQGLIFWGIIINNNEIIQSDKTHYPINLTYNELMNKLL